MKVARVSRHGQGRLSRGARSSARPVALAAALIALALLLAGCAGGGQTGWQDLGPSSRDTIILSLAADPFQHELVYAGSSTGTVYRARGDTTGAPITNSVGIPKTTAVSALLPDPHTAGTVYAGTSSGFYVTTDYGDHWRSIGTGLPSNDTVDTLTFGGNATTLFAGTAQHGVYTSADLGRTWHAANAGLPSASDVYVLLWDSASRSLFAGVDGVGLFVSMDGGQSWTARTAGLPAKVEVFALAELPSHSLNPTGPTIFLGGAQGLFASTDGGQRWTAAGQGLPTGRVLSLAVDPNIPGWIYAGTDSTVYRSPDGGQHWNTVAPGLAHQVSSIVAIANPSTHYVVFAGAGQLVRFPPAVGAGNTLFGNIITWGFVLLLFLLGYYVIRRTRRQVLAEQRPLPRAGLEPRDGVSRQSTTVPSDGVPPDVPPDVPPRTAAMNGHRRPTGPSNGAAGRARAPDRDPNGTSGGKLDDDGGRPGAGRGDDAPPAH